MLSDKEIEALAKYRTSNDRQDKYRRLFKILTWLSYGLIGLLFINMLTTPMTHTYRADDGSFYTSTSKGLFNTSIDIDGVEYKFDTTNNLYKNKTGNIIVVAFAITYLSSFYINEKWKNKVQKPYIEQLKEKYHQTGEL